MSSSFEPVVQLAQKYRGEFEQTYDGLRRRSLVLSENVQQQVNQAQEKLHALEPQVKQTRDEVIQALQNAEPLTNAQSGKVLEIFAWASVLQTGFYAVSVIGALALAPLVGLLLDTSVALLLAYALLPYLAYVQLTRNAAGKSDEEVRFKLLGFAALEGLLVGFILQQRYLSTAQPLPFVTPLAIALVSQLAEQKAGSNRQQFLGVCLGTSVAAHFALGLLTGQLSVPFLLLVSLYTAAGFATLQLFYKYASAADATVTAHVYMYGYFVSALVAQALIFFVFGGLPEKVQDAQEGIQLPSISQRK